MVQMQTYLKVADNTGAKEAYPGLLGENKELYY